MHLTGDGHWWEQEAETTTKSTDGYSTMARRNLGEAEPGLATFTVYSDISRTYNLTYFLALKSIMKLISCDPFLRLCKGLHSASLA